MNQATNLVNFGLDLHHSASLFVLLFYYLVVNLVDIIEFSHRRVLTLCQAVSIFLEFTYVDAVQDLEPVFQQVNHSITDVFGNKWVRHDWTKQVLESFHILGVWYAVVVFPLSQDFAHVVLEDAVDFLDGIMHRLNVGPVGGR